MACGKSSFGEATHCQPTNSVLFIVMSGDLEGASYRCNLQDDTRDHVVVMLCCIGAFGQYVRT